MSGECQVNIKSQSELDIGGRETCNTLNEINKVSACSVGSSVSTLVPRPWKHKVLSKMSSVPLAHSGDHTPGQRLAIRVR